MKLPEKYYHCSIKNIKDPGGKSRKFLYKPIIEEYLETIPTTQGMYLWGGNLGHGKTSLAAIIMKAFAKKGIYGYWLNYRTILDIQFDHKNPDKNRMWDCPLLVVDEFDLVETNVEKSARKTIEFETLIRHRDSNNLPTIITSNKALDEKLIKDYPYVAGIVSVLSDCCDTVKVYGEKWRKI